VLAKMTIQAFADRTGLPASTLRYYEKEGLLSPEIRAENGYRLYGSNQIPRAIKIHSLRQAGIRLTEIREYLEADSAGQEAWLHKWRQEIDAKMKTLHVARTFLNSIEPRDEHIRLVKWDDPVNILWFQHRVKRKMNPFVPVMEERAEMMNRLGLLYAREIYVKEVEIESSEMVGSIGFRLRGNPELPAELKQANAEIATIPPTLFVSMDCLSYDPYTCFRHMLLLQTFGFEPAGPILERYQLGEQQNYEMLIPVVHGDR